MEIEQQIQLIDVEIEAAERAIQSALAKCEAEDLIQSVKQLQQKRIKLARKDEKERKAFS
tara:strand:- start:1317 stop:1496 length:180 start_codon:yes stop_codon:yes gene_type:complete